jgi:hypothetical protein
MQPSYANRLNKATPDDDLAGGIPAYVTIEIAQLGSDYEDETHAVIDCETREVDHFLDWNMKHVIMPYDVWREVNDFLETPAGLTVMQAAIQREMDTVHGQ